MHKILCSIVLIIAIPILCSAGDSKIIIDGVQLSIGMQKTEVQKAFSKTHTLKPLEINNIKNAYMLVRNSPTGESPGVLYFDHDKLSKADQSWGDHRGVEVYGLGKSIYGVFNSVISSGEKINNITVKESIGPDMTHYFVTFEFQNKNIEIVAGEWPGNRSFVTVQEALTN